MEAVAIILAVAAALVFALLWQRSKRQIVAEVMAGEEALKAQRKSYHREQNRLLDALSDAFLIVDPDGIILFANQPARSLVNGRSLEGRSVNGVFLDSRIVDPIEKSLKEDRRITQTCLLPRHFTKLSLEEGRGEMAWLIDAAPVQEASSAQITRVIIRDITNEHQSEQIRKDFVANASHELRTPLAIINGYLENLTEEDAPDPEFLKRALSIMQKHGDRLAHIVEDMLMISKLESGEVGLLNKEPFSLRECIEDVFVRLEPMVADQKAKSKISIRADDLWLLGDRFYWTQVFFNLIENALKQNPSKPLRVEVGAEKQTDGTLKIWVLDDGVGIPSFDLPYIFRRFYRVEKHHNQSSIKGTGLGLSIVKRAVEAHDGKISVTSTPGQKTIFEILLPPETLVSATGTKKAASNETALS